MIPGVVTTEYTEHTEKLILHRRKRRERRAEPGGWGSVLKIGRHAPYPVRQAHVGVRRLRDPNTPFPLCTPVHLPGLPCVLCVPWLILPLPLIVSPSCPFVGNDFDPNLDRVDHHGTHGKWVLHRRELSDDPGGMGSVLKAGRPARLLSAQGDASSA
jgi:hypothetical protein